MELLSGMPAALLPAFFLNLIGSGVALTYFNSHSPWALACVVILALILNFTILFGPVYLTYRISSNEENFLVGFPQVLLDRKNGQRRIYYMILGITYLIDTLGILLACHLNLPDFHTWILLITGATAPILALLLLGYFLGK